MARERLDLVLVERGLAESPARAQALILAGQVRVDGQLARGAAQPIGESSSVEIEQGQPFVSRGGVKLAHALDEFGIDPGGRVVADVGASTGGFTDCLLQWGAARVYAIDVGRGQLHWRLRRDPRVVVMERTHARQLEALPEPVDGATVDVSFISLRQVLPNVFRWLKPGGWTVALIKPQFEAGPEQVERGGVVRDAAVHEKIVAELGDFVVTHGRAVKGVTESPLKGPAGNREFLIHAA